MQKTNSLEKLPFPSSLEPGDGVRKEAFHILITYLQLLRLCPCDRHDQTAPML